MAWDFRQQLRDLADSAGRGLSRVRQRTFVEALTAAHSLMVHAGAPVDREAARERLQTFVAHNEALAGFSAADLEALLARHAQEVEFEPSSAARAWLARVARLRGQDEAGRLLVRVAIAVVGGAASLDGGQRGAAAELCQVLNLPPEDFLPTTPGSSPSSPVTPSSATTQPPSGPGSGAPAANTVRQLRPGERVSLDDLGVSPATPLQLGLSWSGAAQFEVEPAAFLLDQQGRVSGDADMVFYNQPRDAQAGVVLANGRPVGFSLQLDRLPARVQRIAFTLALTDADFTALGGVDLQFAGPTGTLLRFSLPSPRHGETAMVLGELYRRGPAWRFAAVGQGYRGGLAAMCRQFGIVVGD